MSTPKNTIKFGTLLVMTIFIAFAMMGFEDKLKGSISVSGKKKSDFADLAKISMMDALKKAQEKYPGKPIEVELEEEDGYLVYKVEIVGSDKSIMELSVDAGTGAILQMEKEKDDKD